MIPVGLVLEDAEFVGGCQHSDTPATQTPNPPRSECDARQVVVFRIAGNDARLCRRHLGRLVAFLVKLERRAKIQEKGGA